MTLAQRLLKNFGYSGKELLMNPATGSIDKAENWASEASEWADDEGSIFDQFESLHCVDND